MIPFKDYYIGYRIYVRSTNLLTWSYIAYRKCRFEIKTKRWLFFKWKTIIHLPPSQEDIDFLLEVYRKAKENTDYNSVKLVALYDDDDSIELETVAYDIQQQTNNNSPTH